MNHRIGIYIRVSTDEQAQVIEGSLDSQKHRMEGFISMKEGLEKGWGRVVDTYIDDGYSAGDTKRPAYQRLMKDVAIGKVNLILVADLSRLSRNILDFCLLLDYLKKYEAKFLSIKDQFDTSTSIGEMMVFNMITLAQFERKQTSERVSQNFHARAQRGLRNGARAILGYEVEETNKSTLKVNKTEATVVKKIFELFLEEGSSGKTIRRLAELNIKPKVMGCKGDRAVNKGIWTRQTLLYLLSNATYVGQREVNKKNKTKKQENLKPFEKFQTVEASWPAIIDNETFEAAQKILEQAHLAQSQRLTKKESRVFFASSILKCSECGAPFFGSASHGKNQVHRYYAHRKLDGEPIICKVKRIAANALEQDILRYVEVVLMRDGYLDGLEVNIEKVSSTKIQSYTERLKFLKGEEIRLGGAIAKTFELHREMKETSGSELITQELSRLSQEKKAAAVEILELENFMETQPSTKEIKKNIAAGMIEFQTLWKKSTGVQKKKLIITMFEGIYVKSDVLAVKFREPSAEKEKALENRSKARDENIFNLSAYRTSAVNTPSWGTAVENASTVKVGRGGGI